MVAESPYALHPASLDGAIQLGLIAYYQGEMDEVGSTLVPVYLSSMYLSASVAPDLQSANVVANRGCHGLRGASLGFVMKIPTGDRVLSVEGLHYTSYSRLSQSLNEAYSGPFTRLLWKPDIRALDNN